MVDRGGSDDKIRIAIINPDKCKPKKCSQECKKKCPVNKIGKLCIEVTSASAICLISESLCIGCGMCVKQCPFEAIRIINLPKGLESQTTHRYGANAFKLHRLPTPRPGQVLGLVGQNGIGKSTALRVLGGNMRPNLGQHENPPDWKTVLKHFRGSELQSFFTRMLEENLKALIKIQYVDSVAKNKAVAQAFVGKRLKHLDQQGVFNDVIELLDLGSILERQVQHLSGGELQRFIIGLTCVQKVNIYMFDEPSSYLDVKQRLNAARMIRSLNSHDNYIIVVEHDLSVLDYLSDFVCCLYGNPGAYGVVTLPFSVREGINVFLAGFIPTENMRFRDFELNFKMKEGDAEADEKKEKKKPKKEEEEKEEDTEEARQKKLQKAVYNYPEMTKKLGPFHLKVNEGTFNPAETIVMLGQNGTGKTTMIKMLAGILPPDTGADDLPKLNISYKPQTIAPKFEGNVEQLFNAKLKQSWQAPLFKTEILIPLNIQPLLDQMVQNLSGGELQRVAIVLALAKPCDIYLIDEPSAYLDSEQRVIASKVMKRWIMQSKRAAFVVEHDFIMATYMADKVIVFDGEPAKDTYCTSPETLVSGMNRFLKLMDITFRRDPTNYRPRINKHESQKDQEQKKAGNFFLMEETEEAIKKRLAK